ncbi:PPOX class F420-dependent oxidoreductase [Angustibacter sp. McL0619]|uniref:PPOX class F420-dependent oxidoreductase n=1 Tax=Angustibacter sp. McL0619 TaxID=3415676 RepID=UPI003CF9BEF3
MRTMTRDEAVAFLAAGTRTGKLATAGADGNPHVAPIWFLVDGDDLVFTTAQTSLKGRHLRANPRASLAVDDDTFPFSFVVVRGPVTIDDEPADRATWTTRLAARYVPAGLAPEYGERNDAPGESLVRLRMTKVIGQAEIAI